jgi:hypothetical protein
MKERKKENLRQQKVDNIQIFTQLIKFIVDKEFVYEVGSTRRKKVFLLGRTHQSIYLSGTYGL